MAESTDPGATDQLAPDEELSSSKRRTGRTRAGNVSYPSYSSYRASGLGSKDERKSTQVHEGSFGTVVATSMRGWRRTMEDAHCFIWDLHAPEQALPYSLQCVHIEGQDASGIEVDESGNVFDLCAVFDGHVNANVANYAAKNLSTVLLEEISRSLIKRTDIMEAERYVWDAKHVLEETFRQLDENYYKSVHIMCEADSSNTNANADEYAKAPNMQGGCTACVALITKKTIWVANAGDARAVYYSVPPLASTSTDLDLQSDESNVHPLSNDHKPSLPFERERINATGIHAVHKDGRIDGTLSVSRALGDYCFKNAPTLNWKEQAVTCFPDVMSFQRCATPGGVLCVACDGIWEEEPKAEQGKKQYFVSQCLTRAHMSHTVHRLDTDCENAQHAQDVPAQGQETLHATLAFECERILQECLAPSIPALIGCDNMTLLAYFFPHPNTYIITDSGQNSEATDS